ncbi:hypothetical protein pb186bvf_019057 [Paramecium bursaria]
MRKQSQNLFKGRTFIQLGNFILPYRYCYQELVNYFRNILYLQLLSFNSKFIIEQNKIIIFMLITYLYKQNRIYKNKLISQHETQLGFILIGIMQISLYKTLFEETGNLLIYVISSFYIIFHLNNIFPFYSRIINYRFINFFKIEMNNYNQCLNNWKNLRLNHKYLVEQKQNVYSNQSRNHSHIILQTQYSQKINISLRQFSQEIEMKEL